MRNTSSWTRTASRYIKNIFPLFLVPFAVIYAPFLQDIEVTTEKDHNLMSTLLVSTVYPEEGRRSTFVEVATIKSPYSFSFEDGMSTRY